MPNKCCVSHYTGNYDAASDRPHDKPIFFAFQQTLMWLSETSGIRAFRVIQKSKKNKKRPPVVCEKHFSTEFIVREDKVTGPDGTVLSVLRKRPKLIENAYPTIFPNTPSYLSSEPPRKRKTPVDRRQEMSRRDEQQFNDWMTSDRIENFDEMSDKIYNFLKRCLESKWIIKHFKDCVFIGLTYSDDLPRFIIFVRVHNDLSVDVFKGQLRISKQSFQRILGKDNKLCCWSQLDSLISHFDAFSKDATFTVNDQVSLVEQALTELHIW
jgi:hypothetical protein